MSSFEKISNLQDELHEDDEVENPPRKKMKLSTSKSKDTHSDDSKPTTHKSNSNK